MTESETLAEIKKLRSDLESALHMKFDEQTFGEADLFSFSFAVGNAIHRANYKYEQDRKKYESNPEKYSMENIGVEARGLVSILRLGLAWALAHEAHGFEKKLRENLPEAEALLQKTREA